MQSLTLNLLGKSTECCFKTLIYSILLVGTTECCFKTLIVLILWE